VSQPLDYAIPDEHRPSRALKRFANVCGAYPLFLLACLYGEWLLAWMVLGDPPRPSIDDPRSISISSLIHGLGFLLLLGLPAAALGGLIVNIWHLVDLRASPLSVTVRLVALIILWLGAGLVLKSDPGRVLYWFFD
jgi:hypothetical protein